MTTREVALLEYLMHPRRPRGRARSSCRDHVWDGDGDDVNVVEVYVFVPATQAPAAGRASRPSAASGTALPAEGRTPLLDGGDPGTSGTARRCGCA